MNKLKGTSGPSGTFLLAERIEQERKKDGSNDLTCCSFAFEEKQKTLRPSCLPSFALMSKLCFFLRLLMNRQKLGMFNRDCRCVDRP
jgi:hypothetical protein